MPTTDIIDNRKEKLVDHIKSILDSTEFARFAVGYFFLSGLEGLADQLNNVKEIRLLIGNTTNSQTIDQMAEGYRRLDMVAERVEEESYPKRGESAQIKQATAENVRSAVELMDQSDEGEQLIRTVVRLIEEKRLKVRVYTKGRFHAKAYIFDYGKIYDSIGNALERHERGVAIVGSSNLTLSGISHNTELNVVVHGNDNHEALGGWFDELWDEAQDFDEALMQEMKQSWAVTPGRPYDVYMKTIHTLVKDRLDGEDDGGEVLWDDEITSRLADFQKVAVRQAVQMIRTFSGAFVADVVGLGKSYIGAAVVKQFERTEHARPLILCPAPLVGMWERYNEVYQLNARVLSLGYLRDGDGDGLANMLLDDVRFRDRDFVLVDESHNFRHSDTQRYKVLQGFLKTGRRCCFLTATPRNKSPWDVYSQIKLFHQEETTDLPIDPPVLKDFFKLIEKGERKLPDLLSNILIRRTRNHIVRWYGFDSETHQPVDPSRFTEYASGARRAYVMVNGRHQFFPKRQLETIEYSIEDTYQGLYQELRSYLGKPGRGAAPRFSSGELSYARYGLWHYVAEAKRKREPYASLQRAGQNLRGLIRILLFKRFESSVFAFKQTIRRLLKVHEAVAAALAVGIVPAGEEAQTILYESDYEEEADLVDALRDVSGRYDAVDFNLKLLRKHVEHDVEILRRILTLVEPITPDKDAKLQRLKEKLSESPLDGGKRLIFTQYADTAQYLYDNLNPGDSLPDVEVVFSGGKDKARVAGRFSPLSNPEFKLFDTYSEINTLIATDVLSEGLNLQDCNKVINYDLHWNPVRLIQRFGRIDRIGSEHDVVYGFNFLPETALDRNLGLRQKLHNRIQEIHDTIGEDAAILDRTENLNEEAMYAIYERRGGGSGQLALFEEEGEEFLDLNEAEEILRLLRKDDPAEYERIINLRDGLRAAKHSKHKGLYVLCQAGRYQQLYLVDENGEVVSKDVSRILGLIKCSPEESGANLPQNHNSSVMRVRRHFAEEVKNRQAEREHTLALTQGQKYVLRELRAYFAAVDDDDVKGQINILERAFRGPVTTAVNKDLNSLRRNGVAGRALLKTLANLYHQHNIREWADRKLSQLEEQQVPKVVCSEALV